MSSAVRPARTVPLPPQGGGEWEWAAPAPRAPGGPQERPEQSAARPAAVGRARRLWSLLPLAGLLGAAGAGFGRVFATADLLPVLTVAVAAPLALSALLTGVRRRPPALWPGLVLAVVAWLVVVSATLFRGAGGGLPAPAALRAAWTALLDSPHAILTTILPVPGDPALLVLPHAVLWLASFTAAELALRTRAPLLPALPALLAYAVPVVLGVGGPGSDAPVLAVLAGCAGLLVLLRGRVAPSARSLAVALPLVAVLAVLAGFAGPYLPGLPAPYDPRDAVAAPLAQPTATSPLDEVAAWLRNGNDTVFTVRTSGGPAASELDYRLAVLDAYDGVTWSPTTRLARSGGRVPPRRDADPGGTQTVVQHITVSALPGVWLPAADRPADVTLPSGARLSVDPVSGVLSTGGPVPAGLRYTVVSQVPVYDVKRLQYAPAADDPAMTALPRTDAAGQPIGAVNTFTRTAAAATAGSSFPYEQAVRLADWLRRSYRFDPTALPGHTYRQLEFFLTSGKRGTSEQFAAAFAVLARTLGLPARVAVGFRHGTRGPDGAWQVRGRDVLAWPEVEFAGIGWVPFYPTPDTASGGGAAVAPAGQSTSRSKLDQQITSRPRPATPPRPAAPRRTAGARPGGGLPVWAYPPLGAVALAAGYALYAAWVPRRRRARRRGHPDPGQRVLGAWQQIVDLLGEIGLPAGGAHTAAEVAAFGAARVGGEAGLHLPVLADLVNEVGYAGRVPDAELARTAWLHCDAVERTVLRSVPWRRRALRALRPAALRRGA